MVVFGQSYTSRVSMHGLPGELTCSNNVQYISVHIAKQEKAMYGHIVIWTKYKTKFSVAVDTDGFA